MSLLYTPIFQQRRSRKGMNRFSRTRAQLARKSAERETTDDSDNKDSGVRTGSESEMDEDLDSTPNGFVHALQLSRDVFYSFRG